MSEINFFSSDCYNQGSLAEFPLRACKATHDKWTIEAKLSQENDQRDQQDIKDGSDISHAVATFRVYNQRNRIHAFMRVYLQVPLIGTEFASPAVRASQANRSEFTEITALKAFVHHQSTITPEVYAIDEGRQDDQGPVPGGYVARFVFAEVVGVRLGEDYVAPEPDCLTKFFQVFNRNERDRIREVFNVNLAQLNRMGWRPCFPGPPHLIWFSESSHLWFVDFREAVKATQHDNLERARAQDRASVMSTLVTWQRYGLSIPPSQPRFYNDPEKWIL